MVTPLRVCFASSEVAPFAKTGGLADVAGALPRYLEAAGHDARVFMPLYRRVREGEHGLERIEGLTQVPLELGPYSVPFDVWRATLPPIEERAAGASEGGVTVYFLDFPDLFEREALYGDDESEHLRFAAYSHAVLVVCQWLHWAPDIVHCNDWHTGLVPLLLRTYFAWDKLFEGTRSVLTLHNMGYQGVFPADRVRGIGLGEIAKHFDQDDLRAGVVNFLKTGVRWADALTTVSETYAQEICGPEQGMGIDGLLRSRREELFGIVNGVDYSEWDPQVDELIAAQYGPGDLAGKRACRKHLLDHFDMQVDDDALIFGIVSRLTPQKGFELLPDVLPVFLQNENTALCVLGSGEERHERYFDWLAEALPDRVGFHCGYSNELAHAIEAGADAFLMPSRYEPCGLNQMYSLRYGTAPIVRRTGGLADTVVDWDPVSRMGNGFVFDEFSSQALFDAMKRALVTWQDRTAWGALVAQAMEADWSWERQSAKYVGLYERLVGLRRAV